MASQKRFQYKVYTSAGVFITTWNDVISEPTFYSEMNGGYSELKINLARKVDNFGEGVDVKIGNQVKVYVFDKDNSTTGVCIYSGYIALYQPIVDGGQQTLEIVVYNWWAELARIMLLNGTATTLAYSSYDPANILKDILTKAACHLTYSGGSIDLTSTVVSYTYNSNFVQEAVLKIPELCPANWYFRVGADDLVYLKLMPATPTHKFYVGRNIIYYSQEKRAENIVNEVFFQGTGIWKKYIAAGSVALYGIYTQLLIDERVTLTSTADIMANRILTQFSAPEIRITIRVLDNNGVSNSMGYDIESINVGDTCKIFNATSKADSLWDLSTWDVDYWDYDITNSAAVNLQIAKKTYFPDYCELEITNFQPNIAKRIEDINRSFVDSLTVDNPTTPTT